MLQTANLKQYVRHISTHQSSVIQNAITSNLGLTFKRMFILACSVSQRQLTQSAPSKTEAFLNVYDV